MATPVMVLDRVPPSPTAAELIVAVAAARFDVPERELRGLSRSRRVVMARHTAMYLCRTLGGLSLPAIGTELGRDHTTVLHGIRQIQAHRTADVQWRRRLTQIEDQLLAARPLEVACPACALPPYGPAADRDDALQLAGVHDRLQHRGEPTAVIRWSAAHDSQEAW